ncbi:MAG: stage V sporulation protein B [Bacillota bacterium]
MRQTFFKGTLIILAASFVTRILGFVYRILLSRIIGAEGMGLYQMAYPTITVAVTLVTGGLPVAIAKLVAEAEARGEPEKIRTILRQSLAAVVALSLLCVGGMVLAAPGLTRLLNDPRAHIVILAMIPVLPVTGVAAVLRGYFQGKQNMIPSALSVTVEQVARIALSIWLAWHWLPYGIAYSAAGAMLGMVGGELCGLLSLFWQYRRQSKTMRPSRTALTATEKAAAFSALVQLSVPITASRLVGTISYFLEPILVAQSLAIAGIAYTQATGMYGQLAGMAIPLLLFPTVLTYALSVSLVPSVSELAAFRNTARIRQRVRQSMRLALLVGVPFSLLLTVLAEPVCGLVYGTPEVGRLLQLMAPFSLFLYFQGPLNATLQGLGQARAAMFNSLAGAVLKFVAIVMLATRPSLGIVGVAMAIVLSFVGVTVLHWISVSRRIGWTLNAADFLKVGASCVGMGASLQLMWPLTVHLPPLSRLVVLIGVGFVSYGAALLITGAVTQRDVARLPIIGPRVSRWF